MKLPCIKCYVFTATLFLLVASSCDSGDDIITVSSTPAETRPSSLTTADKAVSPIGMDDEAGSLPDMADAAATIMADLRNAAVAEESYYIDKGFYTTEIRKLVPLGYEPSANISMMIATADTTDYCLEAFNMNNPGLIWYFESTVGEPMAGSCR